MDTIFAVSSGSLPAAIAVLRVSGPLASRIACEITGSLPEPRVAALRTLRNAGGGELDRALVIWFPGPGTVTGEDVCELHVHGGRAVVQAVSETLIGHGCRQAVAGEFTRRALSNGKMSIDSVEGLADLLAAETESQRQAAVARAGGAISRRLDTWRAALVEIAAKLEADIDYDGDADTIGAADTVAFELNRLWREIDDALEVAPAERLRDGVRVVIAGPVNAGKSSLFNALVGRDAAIVSDIPGTTRDLIERSVSIDGVPFVFVDTAGIRDTTDPIERIGVERAGSAQESADIVIDLAGTHVSENAIRVFPMADIKPFPSGTLAVSAYTGQGIAALQSELCSKARLLLPKIGEVALDRRHRDALARVRSELAQALNMSEQVLIAEHIRSAIAVLDSVIGGDGLEDVLDALFNRFCLGK